jgi:hypothetical protein
MDDWQKSSGIYIMLDVFVFKRRLRVTFAVLIEIQYEKLKVRLALFVVYTVLGSQADWTLILLPASSCESNGPLAEKNVVAWPVQLAHIVYLFSILVVRIPCYRSRGPRFDSRRYQIF